MAIIDPHWLGNKNTGQQQGFEGYNQYRASVGLPPITIEQAGGGNSLMGKIGRTGVAAFGAVAGGTALGGGGAAGAGGAGGAAGGTGGTVAGSGGVGGFLGQYGPQLASAGLGILGNVLQAKASNQPEQWRQKLIEEELARRNAYEQAGIPSLMGALGYRSPAAGQQLIGQLGKNR